MSRRLVRPDPPGPRPPPEYVEQRVTRDNDYDIEFRGALLARHRHSADGDRWTEVAIYITEGGTYVVSVQFGSASRPTMRRDATTCASPDSVVGWMRASSGGGRLGAASKAALDRAYADHPDLFPLRPVERVP